MWNLRSLKMSVMLVASGVALVAALPAKAQQVILTPAGTMFQATPAAITEPRSQTPTPIGQMLEPTPDQVLAAKYGLFVLHPDQVKPGKVPWYSWEMEILAQNDPRIPAGAITPEGNVWVIDYNPFSVLVGEVRPAMRTVESLTKVPPEAIAMLAPTQPVTSPKPTPEPTLTGTWTSSRGSTWNIYSDKSWRRVTGPNGSNAFYSTVAIAPVESNTEMATILEKQEVDSARAQAEYDRLIASGQPVVLPGGGAVPFSLGSSVSVNVGPAGGTGTSTPIVLPTASQPAIVNLQPTASPVSQLPIVNPQPVILPVATVVIQASRNPNADFASTRTFVRNPIPEQLNRGVIDSPLSNSRIFPGMR